MGSLRFRLTAWNTGVVLCVVIFVLVTVNEGLRLAVTSESVRTLREHAAEVELNVVQSYADRDRLYDEMEFKDLGHTAHHLFVQLFNQDGSVLWSSTHTPTSIDLPPPSVESGIFQLPGDVRALQQQVRMKSGEMIGIRVGMSFEEVNTTLRRVRELSLVAAALVLVVAPAGGFWLAGRATSPLGKIIATARYLQPSNLSRRLPVRGVGDELDRLSETINELLDRIARYLDHHHDFLSNAAHELRSPLAAVQSAIDVALAAPRTPHEYQELLSNVLVECEELSSLVSRLLLLSETEGAALDVEVERVDLTDVVARATEMFRPVAEERGIEFSAEVHEPVFVLGRPYHFRQVVNNLVDNALKFTDHGGSVRIDLDVQQRDHKVVLRVADSGSGIPADSLARIFERFYQADQSHDRGGPRGSGLGLSICESIVRGCNGEITVASEVGRGTTFTVTLPAAPSESSSHEATTELTASNVP